VEDLSIYSHLSNNSIAKHSDDFKSQARAYTRPLFSST